MNEYFCLKTKDYILNNKLFDKNECSFQYIKQKNDKTFHREYYKLCSNPHLCEDRSIFLFISNTQKCTVCGKEVDHLEHGKCLMCNIDELSNNLALRDIVKKWE